MAVVSVDLLLFLAAKNARQNKVPHPLARATVQHREMPLDFPGKAVEKLELQAHARIRNIGDNTFLGDPYECGE